MMSIDAVPDIDCLRLVNAALAVACAGVYGLRINYLWAGTSAAVHVLRIGIFFLFLAVAGASAGAYLRGIPVGYWVPLITVALIAVLVGLFLARDERFVP
jgi:hypothetical protein